MSKYNVYLSSRGIPLVYIGQPRSKPVLTVENYGKWYGLDLVHPDGTVTPVSGDLLSDITNNDPKAIYGDHLINPRMYYSVSVALDAFTCHQSLDMIRGRWISEYDDWQDDLSMMEPARLTIKELREALASGQDPDKEPQAKDSDTVYKVLSQN